MQKVPQILRWKTGKISRKHDFFYQKVTETTCIEKENTDWTSWMLPGDDKKYDIGLDPLPPLWDKFRFLKNIELYERSLRPFQFFSVFRITSASQNLSVSQENKKKGLKKKKIFQARSCVLFHSLAHHVTFINDFKYAD